MRVLIACESSGTTREAFRKLGHEAWSCDLLPADDGSPHHLHGDVINWITDGWDLMIAHPSCTYLCSSGLHWNKRTPGRAEKTEDALRFVQALMDAPIPRIAIENPVGCIGTRIRKADQYIQPHEYGDDASKKTGLWLKNLPKLKPTKHIAPRWVCCEKVLPNELGIFGCPYCLGEKKPKPRWANQTDSGQNRLGPSDDRWKERSKTYQGIADAFAAQWSQDDDPNKNRL